MKRKKKKDENIAARKAREEAGEATSIFASVSNESDAVLVPVPKTVPNVANIGKRKQSDSQDGNNKKTRKVDTRRAAQGASPGPAATVTVTATAKRRKQKKAAAATSANSVVQMTSNVGKRQQSDRQDDGDKKTPEKAKKVAAAAEEGAVDAMERQQ
ncbi:unnamed protein product [Cylindrotheca closterium]|uniref:Uncharacterized protein n=1 Tax=Cylindrotheca closterium TaxID=2856 RepID=A0AAD2CNZ8_9STRA|nr:unnamed protein product [Cylindrotheca closterium]